MMVLTQFFAENTVSPMKSSNAFFIECKILDDQNVELCNNEWGIEVLF